MMHVCVCVFVCDWATEDDSDGDDFDDDDGLITFTEEQKKRLIPCSHVAHTN